MRSEDQLLLAPFVLLMKRCHEGQLDKADAPYWKHPMRVCASLPESCSLDAKVAALLHDVLEDTDYGPEFLSNQGVSPRALQLIHGLTRDKGDRLSYLDWIRHIAATGDAELINIKLHDNFDNLDPERGAPQSKSLDSLRKRYQNSVEILQRRLLELE